MGKSKKKKKSVDRLAVTGVIVTPEYVFENFVDDTLSVKCESGSIFSDTLNKRFEVYKNSQRYLLFKNAGCVCVSCGMVADKCILIAEPDGSSRGHFEFVGTKNDKYVIMTKDHIIPRALGGKDILENYQPMCQECNLEKKHKCDSQDLKDAILSGTADALPNISIKLAFPLFAYAMMFKYWAEITEIPFTMEGEANSVIFKFMPETRSQSGFIRKYAVEYSELLYATYNRNLATSVDKTLKNSILGENKEIKMNLYEQIKSEKIIQMKDKNHVEVGILSVLLGEIDRIVFNLVADKRTDAVIDETVAKVIKKLISTSQENLTKYGEGGYQKEIEVLSRWLNKLPKEPEFLSESETKIIVDGLIAVHGNSKKIVGKIMGEISKTYGATINKAIVKAYLDTVLV